jgi:hypothetical protein
MQILLKNRRLSGSWKLKMLLRERRNAEGKVNFRKSILEL